MLINEKRKERKTEYLLHEGALLMKEYFRNQRSLLIKQNFQKQKPPKRL